MLPDLREVHDYWTGLKAGRAMPARAEFRPACIQKRLPFVTLADVSVDASRFRFRLAGTGLRDTLGIELTGRTLDQLPLGEQTELWQSIYRGVARGVGASSGFTTLAWRGRPNTVQAWLRLPLAGPEGHVTTILGYDRFLQVERRTLKDLVPTS